MKVFNLKHNKTPGKIVLLIHQSEFDNLERAKDLDLFVAMARREGFQFETIDKY